jgi:uncharacterized membrane protein
MKTGRLEAFSDGVLAIIITIMVLELRAPEGHELIDLLGSANSLLTYLLSFVFIGIYWNNHHHMFQIAEKVDGAGLWANLALLFWLSLLPFTTAWVEESHFAQTPVIVYGVNLLMAGLGYFILQKVLMRIDPQGRLARAVGIDVKGTTSVVLYVAGIVCGFVNVWLAMGCYIAVALIWLIPDRRMERAVIDAESREA